MRIDDVKTLNLPKPILKLAEESVKTQEKMSYGSSSDAAVVKPAPEVPFCYCGNYNKFGKVKAHEQIEGAPRPLPRPRPVPFEERAKAYIEKNPVVGKILNKFENWVGENGKRLYSVKGFERFMEQYPGVAKRSEEHLGFINRYIQHTGKSSAVVSALRPEDQQVENVPESSKHAYAHSIIDRIVDRYQNWKQTQVSEEGSLEEFRKFVSQYPRLERFTERHAEYLSSLFSK